MTTHSTTLDRALDTARRALLELSTRSRLLHTPRKTARSGPLEIVNHRSDSLFRLLVGDGVSFTFHAAQDPLDPDGTANTEAFPVPPEIEEQPEDNTCAGRSSETILQTLLTRETLNRRLLRIFHDARTVEEEQGVNVLFLAAGFLKWFESDSSDVERFAPLILIPVVLQRQSAKSRFRLAWSGEEIATNLSLQAKLKSEFGLELPDLPEIEDFVPSEYFARVRQSVAGMPRWEVLPDDAVLGFFSFARFLMYRDLDPANWPADRPLASAGLVRELLQDGFDSTPPFDDDETSIDAVVPIAALTHVRDADSSQALAIEHVRRGKHLVIQGPPGTGKSQTIANIIGAAVKDGKKVLFVAEKMAALEVVQRRLEEIGLGPICLELHSHKANKRAVLNELGQTLELGGHATEDGKLLFTQLEAARKTLNDHVARMHRPLSPSGWTPYRIVGELARAREKGIESSDLSLGSCEFWTMTDLQARRAQLIDVVQHGEPIGVPLSSPWHGVLIEAILPSDVQRLSRRWTELMGLIDQLVVAAQELSTTLACPAELTFAGIQQLAALCLHLTAAPEMNPDQFRDPIWQNGRATIDRLVQAGSAWSTAIATLDAAVAEVAWTTDLAETRRQLAAHGRSWFRMFSKSFREAEATLDGILKGPRPPRVRDQLTLIDAVIRAQQGRALVERDDEIGRRAFGNLWHRENSDWEQLAAIADWEAEASRQGFAESCRLATSRIGDVQPLQRKAEALLRSAQETGNELMNVIRAMKLDPATAFGLPSGEESADSLKKVPLSAFRSRLESWNADPEGLSRWIAFRMRWQALRAGLEELADPLYNGRISWAQAVNQFETAYFESLMRDVFRRHPAIAEFSGQSHERAIDEFRRLDRERIALARREVAWAHVQSLPRSGPELAEAAVVRGELAKKRRHIPIRKLLSKAGRAVQAIKPVFMMSPLSVAQYLEPGALKFDLLLIDEASQVRPVDALGAAARAAQIVVVGDEKQLPPSRFFTTVLEEGADDAIDEIPVSDLESVLGLCMSKNMPRRMLRWHYRSRHHSLIALSNRAFYEDKLCIVPSPGNHDGDFGLFLRHVPAGRYDRGQTATNSIEAKCVAQAVLGHARRHPELSLGVAAFSTGQRDAILDEIEDLRREHSELEQFCAASSPAEPFFVKNLENVQGDERDVIFISVGYGPDDAGAVAMNFGPLSSEGGERRLNVLMTRAKRRCEIFSSITAEQIDLTRARGRGPQVLRTLLKYASTGELDRTEAPLVRVESAFEEAVADSLRAQGLTVTPQVGVAGFFVDLAINDPARPGRYLLGIECDGASYQAARSASDRDRLRHEVLENQGWILHRVWSADWFHRPDDELRKLLAALEAARSRLSVRDEPCVRARTD